MAEICKNCEKEVRVQIQKNTGFCCVKCERAHTEKSLTKTQRKKAAKKAAAKRSVNAVVE